MALVIVAEEGRRGKRFWSRDSPGPTSDLFFHDVAATQAHEPLVKSVFAYRLPFRIFAQPSAAQLHNCSLYPDSNVMQLVDMSHLRFSETLPFSPFIVSLASWVSSRVASELFLFPSLLGPQAQESGPPQKPPGNGPRHLSGLGFRARFLTLNRSDIWFLSSYSKVRVAWEEGNGEPKLSAVLSQTRMMPERSD
ncbi:hypothetical protein C8J56DRAFT_197471 [Mycena floridula]|nr:hypothetical protein C8J56DRAFT_197471 [Mycena floridula]